MMRFHYLLLILLSLFSNYYSQIEPGTKQIALAHSDVATLDGIFSLFSNPAGLANEPNRQLGIYYSPSPYGISELSNGYAAYSEPIYSGNIAFGVMDYGYELYKESKMILGFATVINPKFLLGFTLIYQTVNISRYGSNSQFNFTFGGIFNFASSLSLGFSIHNPLRYSESQIHLPFLYNLGLSYSLRAIGSLNIAIQKEINFPISPRLGFEYNLIKEISLLFGIQNKPELFSGGLEVRYSFMQIGYSVSSHNLLGLTHQADIILTL